MLVLLGSGLMLALSLYPFTRSLTPRNWALALAFWYIPGQRMGGKPDAVS